jgi:hypothetical protein
MNVIIYRGAGKLSCKPSVITTAFLSEPLFSRVIFIFIAYKLQFDLACDAGLDYAPRQLFSIISY